VAATGSAGQATASPRLTVVEERGGERASSGTDGRRRASARTTGRRFEDASHGAHDDRVSGQSTTDPRSEPSRDRSETTETAGTTATPSVFDPDGSVNDRVLDRLYAELRRKERIERDREGR
jgi:hypothetical protein